MFDENEEEVWKDIQGYEGRYQVSSLGRVKSYTRAKNPEGIVLKFSEVDGYNRVGITDSSGYRRHFLAHRLVAMAFIPNINNKPQVNHIDSNRKNNNVKNLEWVTNRENSIHSWEYGGREMSEEHKSKVSKTRIEKGLSKGKNNPMYGKEFSEEHRKKISKTLSDGRLKGRNNPNYGNRKSIVSISVEVKFLNGEVKVYTSIREAGEATGMDNSSLSKRLKKNNGVYVSKSGIIYRRIKKETYNE